MTQYRVIQRLGYPDGSYAEPGSLVELDQETAAILLGQGAVEALPDPPAAGHRARAAARQPDVAPQEKE